MCESSDLPFLKDGQLLLLNFGGATPDVAQWVAFEVSRTSRPFKVNFNFVAAITGFLPLAPYPTAGIPTVTQPFYVSGQYVFPSSVTGVTDALEPQEALEILHGFIGIAPQWLRIYFKQPVNQFEDVMDQNIVPGPTLPYFSYEDGYPDGSPFLQPTPRGEFVSLKKSSLNFDLENPSGVPTVPEFKLLIKRIAVTPADDYDRVHQAFQGRLPAKKWTIGDPLKNGSYSNANYDQIKALKESDFLAPDYKARMQKAGYGGG